MHGFLQEIVTMVRMEEIPIELMFNWDQTGLNLVPVSTWTMAAKGSKRVEICGITDKRKITGVFCGTLLGDFLPILLIYGGKTARCLPAYPFPRDWSVTYSPNHWSNETTMIAYIEEIIAPYVIKVRDDLQLDSNHSALAIFDHFRGQLTPKITECLEKYNILSVLVPASFTDRLQPLDISVNKAAKSFLRSEFQSWYASEISKQNGADDLQPVDLSTARMKCVGGQWLVRLFEHLQSNPSIINDGFQAAGIPQSIDANKPLWDSVLKMQTVVMMMPTTMMITLMKIVVKLMI